MPQDTSQPFKLVAPFVPTGDQPTAIRSLVDGLRNGKAAQTLLGVTGSGKTFTMANVISELQRPALILAHNKTLAAQLCSEFRQFFPENAVDYFVSYYDYYQPEAYLPRTDTYIEKDASINEEIDTYRHAATQHLLTRRDVIIVASVSCIYGLGDVEEYGTLAVSIIKGESRKRDQLLRLLSDVQYNRNDLDFDRGTFRVRGDTVEVRPVSGGALRIEYFGDTVETILETDPLTGEVLKELDRADIFPAKHAVTSKEKIVRASAEIRKDLEDRCAELRAMNKLVEEQRIRQRTEYDLELLAETGYCSGIENYTRYFSNREPGTQPATLLDYFPPDALYFIDESHITLPQVGGMYNGNFSRKQTLVDYGFRLPSSHDNRPLKYDEFRAHLGQVIFVSATPRAEEIRDSDGEVVEQLIRPTGLLDPMIIVRPTENQVDDLLTEIRARTAKHERVLVTTLTKRMAEELTDFMQEAGVKVRYLHSDVETLERIDILRDLRLGTYDVVVGINLLREGLDLPEVSLVAILDADKEGFLRSEMALIQTIGRAARHVDGTVLMYGDRMTDAMDRAISETNRRRGIQEEYNTKHGITPIGIQKEILDIGGKKHAEEIPLDDVPPDELDRLLIDMERQMDSASANLEFEKAAELRDQIALIQERIADRRAKKKRDW